MTLYFEVSADWMQACGHGNEAKVFEVLNTQKTSSPNDFFAQMLTVELNGRSWVVARGRGQFVEAPATPPAPLTLAAAGATAKALAVATEWFNDVVILTTTLDVTDGHDLFKVRFEYTAPLGERCIACADVWLEHGKVMCEV